MASLPTMTHGPELAGSLGVVDHYSLLRKLGGGGFGMVYLARDTVSGIDVAIKTLHPLLKRDAAEMQSLRAKFALVSRLAHPSIATALVMHTVRSADIRDPNASAELGLSPGDHVMVMRYAPGVSLSQWRRQFEGCIVPPDAAIDVARQLASALDYAHGEKIVHRDIKPGNVVVETQEDGSIRARILDFGLAAEIRSSMSRVSNEKGDTSGTRPYMAPEQWSGRPQDGRTDQYALACVVYELLCGAPPLAGVFETGDPVIMRSAVMSEPPARIPGLSRAANAALARALAKNQEDRFPSCFAFVDALAVGIGSSGVIAPMSILNRLFVSDRALSRHDPVSSRTVNSASNRPPSPVSDAMQLPAFQPPSGVRGVWGVRVAVLIAVAVVTTAFFSFRNREKPGHDIRADNGGSSSGGEVTNSVSPKKPDDPSSIEKEEVERTEKMRNEAGKSQNAAKDAWSRIEEHGLRPWLPDDVESKADSARHDGETAFSGNDFDKAKKHFDEATAILSKAEEFAANQVAEEVDQLRKKAKEVSERLGSLGEWKEPEWEAHVLAFRKRVDSVSEVPATVEGLEAVGRTLEDLEKEEEWLVAENARLFEKARAEEERTTRLSALADAKAEGAAAAARILPAFREWSDRAYCEAVDAAERASATLAAISDDNDASVDVARSLADSVSEMVLWMETNAPVRASLADMERSFSQKFSEAESMGVRSFSEAVPDFSAAVAVAEESAELRDTGDYAGSCAKLDSASVLLDVAMEKARRQLALNNEGRRRAEMAAMRESEKAFAELRPEFERVGVRELATNTCARIDELVETASRKRDTGDFVGAKDAYDLAAYMLGESIVRVKRHRATLGVEIAEEFKRQGKWRECYDAAESVLSNWDMVNERARALKSEAWDRMNRIGI